MHKSIVLLFALLLTSAFTVAQEQLTWEDFADVNFEAEFNEKYGVHFLMPTFGKNILSYKDKRIRIKGYFLDISGSGEIFLVSKNPMASCFFCGSAGPETIIEVSFKEKPSFKTDQIVVIEGMLEINANDVDHCNYILNDATGELVN